MRIFLAMGPGDIVADHKSGAGVYSGRGETSITFSQQAIRLFHARQCQALLVSHNSRVDRYMDGMVETRNIPRTGERAGGIHFYLSRMARAIHLLVMARRFRADLAIIDSGSTLYFMLALFRLAGISVVVNFHNVRWPQGFAPVGWVGRTLRKLDSWFFRKIAAGAMGCSPECEQQARTDGAGTLPYFGWVSQFTGDGFDPDREPETDGRFRIVFVGRIERNKGVFDILDMAQILRSDSSMSVVFEICGDGSDLDQLRAVVTAAGLQDMVIVRGRLERAELLEVYGRSHAVIVPTRGDFCEGMPLVCAEAALSGRPVITSRLSNALPVIGPMILEAEPESVASYVSAIQKLATDDGLWRRLRNESGFCRVQFLNRSKSYAAAMDALIAHVERASPPCLAYDTLFGDGGVAT